MRVALLCVLVAGGAVGCGGPSLAQLVDGKHYREALCLAADGSTDDRRALSGALDIDEQLYVHVHVVSREELRATLGDATDEVSARALFARVRAQGNVVPVDRMTLAVSLVGANAKVPAKPLSWTTLAWATHEPLPAAHSEETYLTGINVWRGLEMLFTAGLSVVFDPMRPSTVATEAPPAEYQSAAPHAFALHQAMPGAHCEDVNLGGGGQACEAFFVIDAQAAFPIELEVKATYEADREPKDPDAICKLDTVARVPLGTAVDIAQRTDATFGAHARPLVDVARAPSP